GFFGFQLWKSCMSVIPPSDQNPALAASAPKRPSGKISSSWLRRPARLLLFLLFLLLLLAALWKMGPVAALLNANAATAISRHDYETAGDWLDTVTALRCGNAETAFLRARLARKELRLTEVPQLLKLAMQLGTAPERARREYLLLEAQSGRLQEVLQELNEMLIQDSPDGAEICEAYVNGAVMTGAIDLALTIIPVWKQSWPSDPQPFYVLARILEHQQDTAGALAELNAAVERNPRHWPSLYSRSQLLAGLGRQDEALRDAVAAAAMHANAAPLLLQARCLLNLGRAAEARELLQGILKVSPEALKHSFNLVCEPERGLPVQAELGFAEAALGNAGTAVEWFDQVLSFDPNQLNVRYQRALAMRELGRAVEADAELAEVQQIREKLREIDGLADFIRNNPDQPNVAQRCRIGELFLLYEDARRGEYWLRDTLNHDPNYAPAHKLLADYYDRLAVRQPDYRIPADRHRKAIAEIEGKAAETQDELVP
ncbi:MAG: tetratricopeptide repeat protein, partial [Planctomycetaceae bacterium]